MKVLKKKIKSLLGSNKMGFILGNTTSTTKNHVKGHLDYSSGLWLSGWVAGSDLDVYVGENGYKNCLVKINGHEVYSFTANTIRADLQSIPELKNGLGFNIQLPVQMCANAIVGYEQVEITVSLEDEEIPHTLIISKQEFYEKAFENIYEDVNCYIANIPLFTHENVASLEYRKKVFLLKALFDTNLFKGLDALTFRLLDIVNPTEKEFSEVLDLTEQLKENKSFVAYFLRATGTEFFSHGFSQLIVPTLKMMPYLAAKEVIQGNMEDEIVKEKLILNCVSDEQKKFEFVERFPKNLDDALLAWEQLNSQEKTEYWPLIAECLQFEGRHKELKYISINPALFIKESFDELNTDNLEALRLAVKEKGNFWQALSFLVQATVSGYDKVFLAQLLKEHSWDVWGKEYFDTDTFSFVVNQLLKDEVTEKAYNDICEAYVGVFNYLADRGHGLMHRKVFVAGLVEVINYGVENQFSKFTTLEEVARPHLCLRNTFAQNIDLSPLEHTNYNHYIWLGEFYRKIQKVRAFFLDFDSLHNYEDIEIIEVLQQLLKLKRQYGVQDIDSRLLAVSRYCLLTERVQLYPFLKSIHDEMGDYYTALQLETSQSERLALTQRITEHGKNSKRTDSYWFKEALSSRLDLSGVKSTALIISLNTYLQGAVKNSRDVNVDLAELLVSETLWMAKKEMQVSELMDLISSIALISVNNAFNSLRLYLYLSTHSVEDKSNIEFVSELETATGGYESLHDVMGTLFLSTSSLYNKTDRELFTSHIEQHYVFPYTKVLIYSCNKYEATRHKIIRNTWIKDLNKYGIDYSIIVGDAEVAHVSDDKLCLDVLDTYEELPHKSLRMFEFAAATSLHRHYYKIDDDCVLNVDAMFGDPAFLGSNYFGRIVARPLGGVDRSWHHLKSSTKIAKESLDLSPELSSYCDGSTGYILSRLAVTKLTEQASSADCVQLISSSYFEDKLIGDLLTKAGVESSSEGYNTVIRRCVANGRDVQIWDYGLLPNAATNIKVLHTEDDEFREEFFKQLHSEEAAIPNLIYRDVTSDMSPSWYSKTNQISPILETVRVNKDQIREAGVIAIIVGKNEQEYLPTLLEHHRNLGVEHFLFVDNASSDSSIDYMLEQTDTSVFVCTQEYNMSRFAVDWQETLCSHYCLGKWTLIIDSDELFMFDGFEDKKIQELLTKADEEGANAILSPMVDFYPKGTLDSAVVTEGKPFYETCSYFDSTKTMNFLTEDKYGPYSNSKVMYGGLRERIFGRYNAFPNPNYLNQKYNLIKYIPSMRLIEGLHFMHGHKKFSQECGIMHFKYHSGFHQKVIREVDSGQHWNGAQEYRRYLKLFDNNDSVSLYDETISLKYGGSSSLVEAGYISKIVWSK